MNVGHRNVGSGERERADRSGSGEREQADRVGSGEREQADAVKKGYLPRLNPGCYRGYAFVHWTLTLENRATGWLTPSLHAAWDRVLLHAAVRYALVSPLYVLMPDHIHLLALGVAANSDQRVAIEFIRKHTAKTLQPAHWQKQAHDHVLSESERTHAAFGTVVSYIQNNPVRAKLVADWREYPYLGCCIPGYPDVSPQNNGYWELFWRIYNRSVDFGSARSRSPLPNA